LKIVLSAAVAVFVAAAASQFILTHAVGESSERAYSTSAARP
jgi:hypothetical protein